MWDTSGRDGRLRTPKTSEALTCGVGNRRSVGDELTRRLLRAIVDAVTLDANPGSRGIVLYRNECLAPVEADAARHSKRRAVDPQRSHHHAVRSIGVREERFAREYHRHIADVGPAQNLEDVPGSGRRRGRTHREVRVVGSGDGHESSGAEGRAVIGSSASPPCLL